MSRVLRKWLTRFLTLVLGIATIYALAAIVFVFKSRPVALNFTPTPSSAHLPAQAAGIANYARPEEDAFYTFPEWYIVWSYQAKADFQSGHLPSGYSYFGDIAQYWRAYSLTFASTRGRYPMATGDHVMLVVIGSSFTVEYTLKGLYEKTVGWIFEKTAHENIAAEDVYAAKVAADYATFVHVRPFYEFSFWKALRGLWSGVPFHATHFFRSVERRAWLTLDYGIESFYCELIEAATHFTYGYEDTKTSAWIVLAPGSDITAEAPHVKIERQVGNQAIVEIPRYQEFTQSADTLIRSGVRFRQIAGNELITVSALAPADWNGDLPSAQLLLSQPILSDRTQKRLFLLCPVSELHTVIPALERSHVALEHIYDF